MDDYSFFREKKEHFIPITPVAALKAYENGFAPISAFINKSNSTKPLDEEPYDIEVIERLLSRENLGLRSNIMLFGIFEKLIFDTDQEIALFAAESINIIENRYNKQIQLLKDDLEEEMDLDKVSRLGSLFYELAILNKKREAIKNFFLKEALTFLTQVEEGRALNDNELNTYIRLLLELELNDEAAEKLEIVQLENGTLLLLLKAEVEFSRKKYLKVKQICAELLENIEHLTEKEFVMVSYWMGV